MDTVPNLLESAVLAVLSHNRSQALTSLTAIDNSTLIKLRGDLRNSIWTKEGLAASYKSPQPGTTRQNTKAADRRATFERDKYTCRYLHCRRRTVAVEVLKLLSEAFPDVVPRHRNWRFIETHMLYWTYATRIEHIVPFPSGGTSSRKNLLTACYMCNDAKNHVPIAVLGWAIGPPAESSWRGLTEYIPELRKAIKKI